MSCGGTHCSNTVNCLNTAVKCRDHLACVGDTRHLCCCHDNGCSSMCIAHQCSSCGRAGLRWICLNEWHEVEHVNTYRLCDLVYICMCVYNLLEGILINIVSLQAHAVNHCNSYIYIGKLILKYV